MNLYSPKGTLIVGTLETVKGCAGIDSATRNDDGTFELEWSGDTEIWWDDQTTDTKKGARLFVDEEGSIWKETELALTAQETT